MSWTKPYFGVTHLGELSDIRRATVTSLCPSTHILKMMDKRVHSAFDADERMFDDLDKAKRTAERWVRGGGSCECPKCGHKW